MKKYSILLVFVMALLMSCDKDKELPVVKTSDITEITEISAICGGEVASDGGAEVTARGVCWSTEQNPTIEDNKTSDGSGTGSFTSNIPNLVPNTQYYVRAYATNEKGTIYGEEKNFKTVEITMPEVTTDNVTNITTNSATCGGNVTSDGNGTVTARGVCWSEIQNPNIDNIYCEETTDGNGTGSFTSYLTNLKANTTYYVRAYATNEKGTIYGEEVSFKTESTTGSINGYDWVDLGLPSGLKWATHNVGASSPEEYGDYFAWGETETKEEYTEENSLTYGLSISDLQEQGYIDGSGNLTSSHDAASANWGGSWRMPTEAEYRELVDNCTWEWTQVNGVNGSNVTGPNGNSIFLPAAGYHNGSSLNDAGSSGVYWSSTPYDSNGAYSPDFNSSSRNVYGNGRIYGFTVRPVSE